MNRKPLERRAPLGRRTGLTATAGILRRREPMPRQRVHPADVHPGGRPAGAREVAIPQAARDAVAARSGGRCEASLAVAGCAGDATDVHHRKRRREGGHAVTNLLDLCRPCHRWAHHFPDKARELGLIVSVYEEPADVPARLLSRLTGQRRPVLLLADGSYLTEAAP